MTQNNENVKEINCKVWYVKQKGMIVTTFVIHRCLILVGLGVRMCIGELRDICILKKHLLTRWIFLTRCSIWFSGINLVGFMQIIYAITLSLNYIDVCLLNKYPTFWKKKTIRRRRNINRCCKYQRLKGGITYFLFFRITIETSAALFLGHLPAQF